MSTELHAALVPSNGHGYCRTNGSDVGASLANHSVPRTGGSTPTGFPKHIVSALAWRSDDFKSNDKTFDFTLTHDHICEIEAACAHFQGLDLPLDAVSKATFPLPTVSAVVKSLANDLHTGNGFFIIRGLDPQRYSPQRTVVLYLGLSSYISETRGRQDEHGNMLLHLVDLGSSAAPDDQRQAPYSNVGQPFHTDVGDVIGLFALGEAAQGGESLLASSWTVYNELCRTRPDIVRLLAEPSWVFDRFGQQPPYEVRSIIYPSALDTILTFFARRPLTGTEVSPRSSDIPKLSDAQIEALDTIQSIAEGVSLTLRLSKGDILFWNNRGLLHCRKGFTDTPGHKRHLLRVWLQNEAPEARVVPDELRHLWDAAFLPTGGKRQWPVEPITDREYVTNQQRSSGHA